MSNFWTVQLDFIFFFYGFAFLLLGMVALAIAQYREMRGPWFALGLFGLLHGSSEWLDLLAVIVKDSPLFAAIRVGVMAVSFVFLMEMARLGLLGLKWKVPGRWIYAVLLAIVVAVGWERGPDDANAMARYILGLTGGLGAALFLYRRGAGKTENVHKTEGRWKLAAAITFVLYAISAGVIAPGTLLGPHNPLSQNAFLQSTGVPIQLIRGMLACVIALSVWGIWGQRITRRVASESYSSFWRAQFVWTLASTVAILLCGWALTQYLGGISSQSVMDEGRGDMALVMNLLTERTTSVAGMGEAMSKSPVLGSLLSKPGSDLADAADETKANTVLRQYVAAAGAKWASVVNRSGEVVAKTDRADGLMPDKPKRRQLLSVAMMGQVSYSLAFEEGRSDTVCNVTFPIQDASGEVLGVVMLSKSLNAFGTDLAAFGRPVFLIDSRGIIVGSNRREMLGSTLESGIPRVTTVPGTPIRGWDIAPVPTKTVADGTWIVVEGERYFVRRVPVKKSDWSLVMLIRPEGIRASRALGIIITLLTAVIGLVYHVGLERRVHDTVQADKRLQLEELARKLDLQATTDALTGTSNRLKFNDDLSRHISSAQRYGIPLSLLLFDVDNFKLVNDTFGHLVGDGILIRISDLTRECLRASDMHARWGGEEFVVLAPGTSIAKACKLAEKLRRTVEAAQFDSVQRVTCSFGVVQLGPHDTAETLVARADGYLYMAKMKGKNRVESGEVGRNPSAAA